MNRKQTERREMRRDILTFALVLAVVAVAFVVTGALDGPPRAQPETWSVE